MRTTMSSFELGMSAFLEQRDYRTSHRRGYVVDEGGIYLDSHPIARWRGGAVIMVLKHPEYQRWRLAQAIRKVRAACEEAKVLGDAGERICREHADCRALPQLAEACYRSRSDQQPAASSQPRSEPFALSLPPEAYS